MLEVESQVHGQTKCRPAPDGESATLPSAAAERLKLKTISLKMDCAIIQVPLFSSYKSSSAIAAGKPLESPDEGVGDKQGVAVQAAKEISIGQFFFFFMKMTIKQHFGPFLFS